MGRLRNASRPALGSGEETSLWRPGGGDEVVRGGGSGEVGVEVRHGPGSTGHEPGLAAGAPGPTGVGLRGQFVYLHDA